MDVYIVKAGCDEQIVRVFSSKKKAETFVNVVLCYDINVYDSDIIYHKMFSNGFKDWSDENDFYEIIKHKVW